MITKLFMVIAFIALLVLALNTIGSVIYLAYLWGSTGMEFPAALWQASLTWLTVGLSAAAVFLTSLFIAAIAD